MATMTKTCNVFNTFYAGKDFSGSAIELCTEVFADGLDNSLFGNNYGYAEGFVGSIPVSRCSVFAAEDGIHPEAVGVRDIVDAVRRGTGCEFYMVASTSILADYTMEIVLRSGYRNFLFSLGVSPDNNEVVDIKHVSLVKEIAQEIPLVSTKPGATNNSLDFDGFTSAKFRKLLYLMREEYMNRKHPESLTECLFKFVRWTGLCLFEVKPDNTGLGHGTEAVIDIPLCEPEEKRHKHVYEQALVVYDPDTTEGFVVITKLGGSWGSDDTLIFDRSTLVAVDHDGNPADNTKFMLVDTVDVAVNHIYE